MTAATPTAHLRAVVAETTAELCGHHVPLANCIQHRQTTEETE